MECNLTKVTTVVGGSWELSSGCDVECDGAEGNWGTAELDLAGIGLRCLWLRFAERSGMWNSLE